MSSILAAIDTSAAAGPVLATALAIAELFDARAEAIHVRDGDQETAQASARRAGVPLRTASGPPLETLLSAAREEEVEAVVIGARAVPLGDRPVGAVARAVVTSLRKPIVVVPPHAPARARIDRVLVPLAGTPGARAAMIGFVERAQAHERELVLLHVYGERSIPSFTEQPAHEMEAWSEEFLARHCPPGPAREVRLETRVGSVPWEILRVSEQIESHLLALCWSQVLTADRGNVVRQCLEQATTPILLVPYLG